MYGSAMIFNRSIGRIAFKNQNKTAGLENQNGYKKYGIPNCGIRL